ncbi:uncharacterized protein EV420DRAFT_1592662 [Desarmillaria tabescens]|uniref:HNH nuclease domain-containing protein n=1 Tax=Armillaria tabescens TaxID=1929756 RepID=A0AA39J7I1_ARMTA|nr:uncharacterized protein EV420DRAFT_1592662 [Desarmillaria tabescens]KAK0435688.1 hypothetical protein EV420DRAFT_1592662 [Desarmillaria tabescens]
MREGAWNEPTIMPAAALPPVETINGLNENGISAYNICLEFEKSAPAGSVALMHARILGYLIIHSPSPSARHEVVKVIHSCAQDHAKLSQLGQTFLNYFIRPFKKFKGRTPAPSDHPSRPSFDVLKRDLRSKIREAPKSHTEAKDLALVRDGFRCVVTGSYDHNTVEETSASTDEIGEAGTVYTRCAHIVPESTYFNVSDQGPSNTKLDYAASVLAVLKRFGYDIEQTNGTKVHSLYNVMTMEGNVHDWFDRLEIWFEKTKTPNCYKLQNLYPKYRRRLPAEVTFTTPDQENLPVPSETLLSLHAACAKVAHLSGAAEYIDKLDRDVEDLSVLAYNGSSGEVLRNALLNHMNQVVGVGA